MPRNYSQNWDREASGAVYLIEDTTLDGAARVIKEMSMQGTGTQPVDPLELKQAIDAFKQEAILLANRNI